MLFTRRCGHLAPDDDGTTQTLTGWLQETRNLGGIAFLTLRDRTGEVQLTLPKRKVGPENYKAWTTVPRESVVLAHGTVKVNAEAPGGLELVPERLEVLGRAATPLPLGVTDRVDSELETRLNARYMDLRRPEVAAHFQIRAAITRGAHRQLRREGFLETQTPKIIASATEGGTGLFPVEYFERQAYLSQSPQLYKQILMSGGLDRVYEVGPAFRAEEHNTPRHLNEFTSIDIEMSFADDDDVMSVMERVIAAVADEVAREVEALALLGRAPLEVQLPLPRLTYDEAVELAKGACDIAWGDDLSMEATRAIAAQHDGFYFITRWPLTQKPFYIQPLESDPRYSRGFDFMYREIEMTSGGQRVHDVELLERRLREQELDPVEFEHYLAPFRYGMPPHGGWGLGLDRLTMVFTSADNVRECVLFPRDRHRLTP